ncbi:MAG: hypothetical protein COX90_04420 [Candidatus Nealsonbacteria bacterium CG_4_10_14_0_2_um_filter_38_17]|uniref:Uncharacterized protein n=2 Tax=Candidatus Nealsoniibacteriota TaxID=1817911 RepID=A0A2M7UWW4_9BACT|nr:MAG: hypothetical protein COX36_04130 [Candidatus Nealsonbacteria bacterium CG23_combo_of_CG06-09_8_20_14_all_38_19]PIZ88471.1 MAG: hypothetical protein COX90_04420 [Candidatus Nealsonbacteria bacterium CG_4_10_14_0_2_um_filter_38_17]
MTELVEYLRLLMREARRVKALREKKAEQVTDGKKDAEMVAKEIASRVIKNLQEILLNAVIEGKDAATAMISTDHNEMQAMIIVKKFCEELGLKTGWMASDWPSDMGPSETWLRVS